MIKLQCVSNKGIKELGGRARAAINNHGFSVTANQRCIAFFSPKKGQNDPYRLPKGPGYDEYADRMRDMIAALSAESCERVAVTSRDGLRLTGRFYRRADGGPVDICMHGYRGMALRDFCGGAGISDRKSVV